MPLAPSAPAGRLEIIVRGDSPYPRPKAMAWCEPQRGYEPQRVGCIFGLSGNPVLLRVIDPEAQPLATAGAAKTAFGLTAPQARIAAFR
jgi:hypothetical protein